LKGIPVDKYTPDSLRSRQHTNSKQQCRSREGLLKKKNKKKSQEPLAHTYNPSYSEGRDQKDHN
jgi:hypothetical protein